MTKVRVRYAPSPTGHLHIGKPGRLYSIICLLVIMMVNLLSGIERHRSKRNIEDGEKASLKTCNG